MGYNYQPHRYFLPSQDPEFSSHLIKANLSKLPITSKRLSPPNYVFLIMPFQLWFSVQPVSNNSHPHGAPKSRSSMALRPHTKALTPGILLSHVRYYLVQHRAPGNRPHPQPGLWGPSPSQGRAVCSSSKPTTPNTHPIVFLPLQLLRLDTLASPLRVPFITYLLQPGHGCHH